MLWCVDIDVAIARRAAGMSICGVGASWVYVNQESSTIIIDRNDNLFPSGEHVLKVHARLLPVTYQNLQTRAFLTMCVHTFVHTTDHQKHRRAHVYTYKRIKYTPTIFIHTYTDHRAIL